MKARFRQELQLRRFFELYHKQLIREYALIPIGVLMILCVLYGFDTLFKRVFKIKFPASVAVMLINFVIMCVLSAAKQSISDIYIKCIDVPLGWSLRWMNLYFTPAFVMLPTSPPISAAETGLIAVTFIVGYIVAYVGVAYITMLCQLCPWQKHREDESLPPEIETEACSHSESAASINSWDDNARVEGYRPFDSYLYDGDLADHLMDLATNSGVNISRTVTNTSRPFTVAEAPYHGRSNLTVADLTRARSVGCVDTLPPIPQLLPTADVSKEECNSTNEKITHTDQSNAESPLPEKVEELPTFTKLRTHLHHGLYTLGLIASIISYFASDYPMPFQFFTAVCLFMLVNDIPLPIQPKYRRLLHPVLCSVALTWLIMLIAVLIKHRNISYFISELHEYQTGRNYLHLFDTYHNHTWPGAGDVFSSCMDVSIVGLSMPMFTYRRELWRHFMSLVPPIICLTVGSLTLYPLICHKIGISTSHSIGFIGRSATLALSTPTVLNLNGSITLMAVTTVATGILGAITGGPTLDWLKVPADDFVTRGVTMGTNCGAIATAYLLGVDHRAAAISTLSFVLFGTLIVILSSIGGVQTLVDKLATL
ncbi:HDL377Cp [Eremothecium sinecaudum]|uniref:HDL377Cp n=1 Tax=Eremothecium sinecaudum TaxID=45286 RepID=A0A0X8HRY5_9SACH|nr:HDL377Cp [Eremothecium sinecaudum]AMD20367.1 HDL377Cp [Eremothecium sinecaudum]